MFALEKNREERKPVSASSVNNKKIKIFSEKLYPYEFFYGGKILEIVHQIAAKVANTHAGILCKGIGIDFVRFFSPVKRGDILLCQASVNRVWKSYLEVGSRVIAEDFRTLEQKKVFSAYFTFIAIDEEGKEQKIAQIIPETEQQKKRFRLAEKRRRKKNKISFLKKSAHFIDF